VNAWTAFFIGLSVGACFALWCASWVIHLGFRSTQTDYPDEVAERLEAQREAGRQGLN
jgi:hypothetical protein